MHRKIFKARQKQDVNNNNSSARMENRKNLGNTHTHTLTHTVAGGGKTSTATSQNINTNQKKKKNWRKTGRKKKQIHLPQQEQQRVAKKKLLAWKYRKGRHKKKWKIKRDIFRGFLHSDIALGNNLKFDYHNQVLGKHKQRSSASAHTHTYTHPRAVFQKKKMKKYEKLEG